MRRWVWIPPVGAVLFICYYLQSRSYGVNSDAASQALQAWDMLHGNVLLTGWSLSDVSFYTTELPEYMLVEAVRGLGADVVHVSAALTYTLLVLLAAVLGRGRATGREGAFRALIAGGIMVAPQLNPGTQIAPAIASAVAGACGLWMPSDPNVKNPNAASPILASTALAGLSV